MKSKLKVVNLDANGKKVTVYGKVIEINPQSSLRFINIREFTSEQTIVGNETSEVRFDSVIHWYFNITGVSLGGLSFESVAMQDAVTVQLAPVDTLVDSPVGTALGFVTHSSYLESPVGLAILPLTHSSYLESPVGVGFNLSP